MEGGRARRGGGSASTGRTRIRHIGVGVVGVRCGWWLCDGKDAVGVEWTPCVYCGGCTLAVMVFCQCLSDGIECGSEMGLRRSQGFGYCSVVLGWGMNDGADSRRRRIILVRSRSRVGPFSPIRWVLVSSIQLNVGMIDWLGCLYL